MDRGKWTWGFYDGVFVVGSDDFSRDVSLVVSGDFKDEADAKAYMDWLTGVLNAQPSVST